MKLLLFVSALVAVTASAKLRAPGGDGAPFPMLPPKITCTSPENAVVGWYNEDLGNGPNSGCIKEEGDSDKYWIMLRSYRQGGGKEKVTWKYATSVEVDIPCLTNYTIYMGDGTTKLKDVTADLTMYDSPNKPWCALPVYREGGVKGKQWAYCDCKASK